jgi:cobalt-zinc-cadmium efflux system outer membrane protein
MPFHRLCCLAAIAWMPALAQPQPLDLEAALREAAEHNLNLLADRYNVSIADARLLTAGLRPNPVLTVSASNLQLPGETPQLNPRELSWRADFVVERGRKRAERVAVARSAKSVAELELLNALRALTFDVESAFVDVLLARATLAVARQNFEALNGIAELNAIRVRAGDLAGVEWIRSRVAALESRNSLEQARLRLENAKNRLQLLLGRPAPAPDFDIAGDFRQDAVTYDRDEIVRQAFQARPDLLALRRQQARTQAELRLQLAQGKVDYVIGAEFGRQQQPGLGQATVAAFSVSVPLPVFNRNQGEIRRAEVERQQNEARLRALEAAIRNEAESAFRAYSTSRTLLDTFQREMIEQAAEVRRITEFSYRRGEASLLEFLDAQRAFNDVMQGYNDARAEYARSLYLIDSVTGKSVNP